MGRMKRGQKVTDFQCIKALRANKGLIGPTARACGITYDGIYKRIKNNPELEKVMNDAREDIVDTAEAELFIHVEQGNLDAIKFTLSRIGKKRGYSEKTEVEHTGDVHLHFDKEDEGL